MPVGVRDNAPTWAWPGELGAKRVCRLMKAVRHTGYNRTHHHAKQTPAEPLRGKALLEKVPGVERISRRRTSATPAPRLLAWSLPTLSLSLQPVVLTLGMLSPQHRTQVANHLPWGAGGLRPPPGAGFVGRRSLPTPRRRAAVGDERRRREFATCVLAGWSWRTRACTAAIALATPTETTPLQPASRRRPSPPAPPSLPSSRPAQHCSSRRCRRTSQPAGCSALPGAWLLAPAPSSLRL